jgi:hypothetical protein
MKTMRKLVVEALRRQVQRQAGDKLRIVVDDKPTTSYENGYSLYLSDVYLVVELVASLSSIVARIKPANIQHKTTGAL